MTYVIYNDIHLIPVYIQLIIGLTVLLAAAIVTHELGHIAYLWFIIKKKVKFRFRIEGNSIWNWCLTTGTKEDYKELTTKQYINCNWAGIVAGSIPIIVMTLLSSSWVIAMLIPYAAGCVCDFKNILKFEEFEEGV